MTRILTCIILFFWAVAGSTLVYWQWFDNPELIYNQDIRSIGPVHLTNNPNPKLQLHSKFCLSRPTIPATTVRTITNAAKYFLADIAASLTVDCYDLMREISLPGSMVPGRHLYNFEVQFQVNPIKKSLGKIKPVPFEVVP